MAASFLPKFSETPMQYVDETLEGTHQSIEHQRQMMIKEQYVKAPYLVGSIADVNRRVSKLDRKLQSYTALVVESRNSDKSEKSMDYNYFMHEQDENSINDYERRLKEIQEVNQFAGIYAIKSTFLTKPSERAKNISQISMQKNNKAQYKKMDSGKPKFVELHQFPGYDADELTELPNFVRPKDMLDKVVSAHPTLHKTPLYRPEFERLFYSQMSRAILQDVFWFLFLKRWGPNSRAQQGMFNRVAHNYVKILFLTKEPKHRETFLRDFPALIAQGVYAAYCVSFPDSYRQFGEPFREDLVNLVYEWIVGLRPVPRTWLKWNMSKLEPANIKNREELLKQTKNNTNASLLDFSFLDQPPSHISGSLSTVNQAASVSSMSSAMGKKHRKSKIMKRHQDTSLDSGRGEGNQTARKSKTPADLMRDDDDRRDLTPIREFDEDRKLGALSKSAKYPPRESHMIGKGAIFSKSAFNTYGKSPLLAQYLRMHQLTPRAGMAVRMQMTKIDSLPPLEGKTYRDLVKSKFKKLKSKQQTNQVAFKQEQRLQAKFVFQQKAKQREHLRKQGLLLSQKKEVQRLSDLIMLELLKDADSVSANSVAAIEQALNEQR